ncbi:MAG: hypothetical protein AAF206_18060 [Bacteroidota bacterium]
MIALFFQLPTHPVKIGDKWSLDINLIANDQTFVCDSAYKINEVTLSDIRNVKGEKIALIQYNIEEYVQGTLNLPSFLGKKSKETKSTMKFSFQGIGEFSVDKGRWATYEGTMILDASGPRISSQKTRYALIRE